MGSGGGFDGAVITGGGSGLAAADTVREAFGNGNVLCADVGVQQFGAVERLTDDDWTWVLNMNVTGSRGSGGTDRLLHGPVSHESSHG